MMDAPADEQAEEMPTANGLEPDTGRTVRNLAVFTALVFASGWLGRWLDSVTGDDPTAGAGILIWLIAPLGLSLLLRAFAGDGWRDLGIRPAVRGSAPWYVISLLAYPLNAAFVVVVGLALGAVSLANWSVTPLFLAFALAIIPGLLKAVEEFGWRGYLAPKVYSLRLNAFAAHAVVGIIWGAWHLPYLGVFWDPSVRSSAWFVPCFFLGTVATSIFYGEIRMQTASVWPAFLMHAVGNTVSNTLVAQGFLKTAPGRELLTSPGVEGVLSIAFFTVAGVGLHLLRRKRATAPG